MGNHLVGNHFRGGYIYVDNHLIHPEGDSLWMISIFLPLNHPVVFRVNNSRFQMAILDSSHTLCKPTSMTWWKSLQPPNSRSQPPKPSNQASPRNEITTVSNTGFPQPVPMAPGGSTNQFVSQSNSLHLTGWVVANRLVEDIPSATENGQNCPKRKGSYSNHPFSGDMLVSGRVYIYIYYTKTKILYG